MSNRQIFRQENNRLKPSPTDFEVHEAVSPHRPRQAPWQAEACWSALQTVLFSSVRCGISGCEPAGWSCKLWQLAL